MLYNPNMGRTSGIIESFGHKVERYLLEGMNIWGARHGGVTHLVRASEHQDLHEGTDFFVTLKLRVGDKLSTFKFRLDITAFRDEYHKKVERNMEYTLNGGIAVVALWVDGNRLASIAEQDASDPFKVALDSDVVMKPIYTSLLTELKLQNEVFLTSCRQCASMVA